MKIKEKGKWKEWTIEVWVTITTLSGTSNSKNEQKSTLKKRIGIYFYSDKKKSVFFHYSNQRLLCGIVIKSLSEPQGVSSFLLKLSLW